MPLKRQLATSLAFVLAACVSGGATMASTPAAEPAPASPPSPEPKHWIDAERTPGEWRYISGPARTSASYGAPGAAPAFTIACDWASHSVTLARAGAASGPVAMRILTETETRLTEAQPLPQTPPMLALTLPSPDPLLDAMAFSRGRFAVETYGLPTLYLPSWPEITRVVEDCR